MINQNYGGIIWTNHALSRLGQRGLTQELAWQAFQRPDQTKKGKEPGTMQYEKRFGQSLVTIIAKQNDKKEWVVISCWINPPLAGSIDVKKKEEYKKYQKSSFLSKFLLTAKKQLGL